MGKRGREVIIRGRQEKGRPGGIGIGGGEKLRGG